MRLFSFSFSSRRRHTSFSRDWSSDVCSSDLGAFHPPRLVVADPCAIATLPRAERAQGLVEAFKHGAIVDADYFDRLERDLPALRSEERRVGKEFRRTKADNAHEKKNVETLHT